jgi:ACT domain-containing protein
LDPPLKLKKRNPLKQLDKNIITVLQHRRRKPEIEKARFYVDDAKPY